MDLLLDIDTAIDICTARRPFAEAARQSTDTCVANGGRIWLYAGSVQALESATSQELDRQAREEGKPVARQELIHETRQALKTFCSDTHWLSALSGEGDVFDADAPGKEQLLRAMDRFRTGEIALLTRDERLLERGDPRILSPKRFLASQLTPRPVQFIDLQAQQDIIRAEVEQNIHRVLHHGRYIMGPEIGQLEEKLAAYVGVKHCITTSSGTDSLLIAMMTLGIGPGHEVITTPFSFIATGETIAFLGAKPVFVDILPSTYNMDPAKIEAAVTSRTRAIMPVSLYGQCADMDPINAIADKHGLAVIEDGAQSFGATYRDRRSSGLSTIGSTSFFPSKPLGCYGDGGALFTEEDSLADAMREIRVHGQKVRYHHPRIGLNGRLDTLQAAILLAKLNRFDWEVERRQAIGARYNELFRCSPLEEMQVVVPHIQAHNTSVYAQYTITVADRESIAQRLKSQRIPYAVHYPTPLHLQPALAKYGYPVGSFPVSEAAANRVMSLPMGADLTPEDQSRIVTAVTNC